MISNFEHGIKFMFGEVTRDTMIGFQVTWGNRDFLEDHTGSKSFVEHHTGKNNLVGDHIGNRSLSEGTHGKQAIFWDLIYVYIYIYIFIGPLHIVTIYIYGLYIQRPYI